MKIGDLVQVIYWRDRKSGSPMRITRETATQWVTEDGKHWKKSDGYMVPRYLDYGYRIVPVAEEAKS